MIDPDIRIVDLDTEGFAHLSEVLSRRAIGQKPEIHVLHDAGKVLNVVHTSSGVIAEHRGDFTDAHMRAEQILKDSDAGRVVMIDKSMILDLPAQQVELAKQSYGQGELLWKSSEAFWTSPGVATAPAPPIPSWLKLQERIQSFGDDFWAVVVASDICLVGHFEGGYLTLLTSGNPESAIEETEQRGPVPLALVCDLELFDAVLSAPDPLQKLGEVLPGATLARGIKELIEP